MHYYTHYNNYILWKSQHAVTKGLTYTLRNYGIYFIIVIIIDRFQRNKIKILKCNFYHNVFHDYFNEFSRQLPLVGSDQYDDNRAMMGICVSSQSADDDCLLALEAKLPLFLFIIASNLPQIDYQQLVQVFVLTVFSESN